MESVTDTFYYLYLSHKEGVEYTLSEDAQNEYDGMVDSYAELLNEKYQMHLGMLTFLILKLFTFITLKNFYALVEILYVT